MKHFKVTNYGVYDEVTGTSVMLEVDGLKILFDYGLYQSNLLDAKQVIEANWKAKKDIPLEEIDYVIVTHAHADHSGGLPILFRPDSPFKGRVLCTEPSAPLISMICCDSAFVQQNQIKGYLKKHPKQELYPNYSNINENGINKDNFNIYLENKMNDDVFIKDIFNKLFV